MGSRFLFASDLEKSYCDNTILSSVLLKQYTEFEIDDTLALKLKYLV